MDGSSQRGEPFASIAVVSLSSKEQVQHLEFQGVDRFRHRRANALSTQIMPLPPSGQAGLLSRLLNYLKAHPILFLILLTPGIPEYLSGSSSLSMLAINPVLFFLFLGANIGLYGSGVILIREAMIRWRKGWASVFLLGVAYGIVEEGLALRTLFNPAAPQVGVLGVYGRWLGVNWVWTVGLLIFHSVYSIGLPIFLFGLVFPSLKGKSLVSRKGIRASVIALIIDSILLQAIVNYDPGAGLILISGLVVTVLVLAATKLPGDFMKTKSAQPTLRPLKFAMLGALLFPASLFTESIAGGVNAPPIITAILDIVVSAAILMKAFRSMGTANNQEHKVALGVGLIIPIVVFGLIATLVINPLIVLGDMTFILFSRRLWRKWHHWSLLQRSGMPIVLPGFGGSPTNPISS